MSRITFPFKEYATVIICASLLIGVILLLVHSCVPNPKMKVFTFTIAGEKVECRSNKYYSGYGGLGVTCENGETYSNVTNYRQVEVK